jgi:hypothetical protein
MGTTTCPEIRTEFSLSPKERAAARDSFVRAFERQFSDWTEIARVAIAVERDKDYLLLGFQSWHAWLLAAAPRSRSYIYLVVGRYKELSPDIPDEDLAEIPITATGVLKSLSPAVRKLSNIRQAAKGTVQGLRQKIRQEHPDQHIEGLDARTLNFTESQAVIYDEMLAVYRVMNNHEASAEEAVEWIASQWLDGPWEDSGYSNRQRANQIGANL